MNHKSPINILRDLLMFKLYTPSNLIGYCNIGLTEFSQFGSDSKASYEQHCKTQDDQWYYHNTRVFYNRNTVGHRSKNIEDLRPDFVLFAGCSITEGIGVRVEDSFAYNISKNLNVDYYNLALNGAGPDLVSHNIGAWFQNIRLKPKAVIIQWPSTYRVFYKEKDNHIFPLGPWSCKPLSNDIISEHAWNAYEAMITTNFFDHYTEIFKSTIVPLLKASGIKVITFTTDDIEIVDYARDLKHPGVKSHKNISDQLTSLF